MRNNQIFSPNQNQNLINENIQKYINKCYNLDYDEVPDYDELKSYFE